MPYVDFDLIHSAAWSIATGADEGRRKRSAARPTVAKVEQQQWRGKWWRPDESDESRPGTLSCSSDGDLRLELIGGFDVEVREALPSGNGYAVRAESRAFPILHGKSGGHLFSLLGNIDLNTTGGFLSRNITQQDWHSDRALWGIHLRQTTDAIFSSSHLQIERLLGWSSMTSLNLSVAAPTAGQPEPEIPRRQPVEPLRASHAGLKISLGVTGAPFQPDHEIVSNRRSLAAREWATLSFEANTPVSHDAFHSVGKAMQDLLTLASYAPCGVLSEELVYDDAAEYEASAIGRGQVTALGRQIYRTKEQRELEATYHPFLFTLADCDFAEIVPRWLDLKGTAQIGCDILFGQRYISNGYVGARLLGVASAAESIHRSMRSAALPLPAATFKTLQKTLSTAIAGEPAKVRAFVASRMQNQPTFLDRLLDLASIPDAEVVDELLTDRECWAALLKRARNDLAHANPRVSGGEAAPSAFWLLEVSYALMSLVLMAELGLDDVIQRRALDHPQISHASREFAKVVNAFKD